LLVDTNGDRIPDFPIGRLSVRTLEELQVQMAKTLRLLAGRGAQTALLIGDAPDTRNNLDFAASNLSFEEQLMESDWSVSRLQVLANDSANRAEIRSELFSQASKDELDLLVYNGHSSQFAWSGQNILNVADADEFKNDWPFISVQWGCWNSYFSSPARNTLADTLLNQESGAGLVMGSSTLSVFDEQDQFKPIFNRYVLQSNSIGAALTQAKWEFGRLFTNRPSVILGLNILGDPLVPLAGK
jgi:hypothetical protein